MNNPLRILETLDRQLTAPIELTVFGRAALALGYAPVEEAVVEDLGTSYLADLGSKTIKTGKTPVLRFCSGGDGVQLLHY